MKTEPILLSICFVLCISGLRAQESAESGEAGVNQGRAGGGNQGGAGGVNPPGGPVIPDRPGLAGPQLQIINTRLGFVRRELDTISLAIGRFLFLDKEQNDVLKQELQLALEVAIFGLPPPPSPADFPLPPSAKSPGWTA